MAYAFVAGYNGTNTASVNVTIAAGQSLIAMVGNATTQNATLTITDTLGNTYVTRGTRNDVFNGATRTLLDCVTPAFTGATTITVAGGGSFPQIVVLVYTGIASYSAGSFASAFFGSSPPLTTDGCTTTSITPTSYAAALLGLSYAAATSVMNAGTGFAATYSVTSGFTNGDVAYFEDLRMTSGSHIASFTASGTPTSVMVFGAAYIESGVVPPPTVPSRGPMPKLIYTLP